MVHDFRPHWHEICGAFSRDNHEGVPPKAISLSHEMMHLVMRSSGQSDPKIIAKIVAIMVPEIDRGVRSRAHDLVREFRQAAAGQQGPSPTGEREWTLGDSANAVAIRSPGPPPKRKSRADPTPQPPPADKAKDDNVARSQTAPAPDPDDAPYGYNKDGSARKKSGPPPGRHKKSSRSTRPAAKAAKPARPNAAPQPQPRAAKADPDDDLTDYILRIVSRAARGDPAFLGRVFEDPRPEDVRAVLRAAYKDVG